MYEVGQEEIDALSKVVTSQKLFRYRGENQKGECDLFEEEFATKMEVPHAILLSSGTNSLFAALLTLGIGEGDEVIIPSYTFVATAAAVTLTGATPIVAEIDETLTISCEEILKKISNQTRAIIPVHMDGLCSNMDDILEIAKEKDLYVIEDVAQAIGGSYKKRRLGSLGDFGCFSLNADKIISSGEGGILITKNQSYYTRSFLFHDNASQYGPTKKEMFANMDKFVGYTMRVSEITGAIARVQLKRLDPILENLRTRKKILTELLCNVKGINISRGHCPEGDCGTALHLSLSSPDLVGKVARELLDKNIVAAPLTTRFAHTCWQWGDHLYGEAKGLKLKKAFFLQTLDILSRTLKIELNPQWTPNETQEVAAKIIRILGEHGQK